jgi:hypothetical protein
LDDIGVIHRPPGAILSKMLDAHAPDRLAEAGDRARAAEARGDDAMAGEEWRRYRLIRDAARDPDELLAEGIALSVQAAELSENSPSVGFAELLARAETRRVDGVEAPICSLADLVALKRSVGRERDLVDLADLEAAHGDLPDSRDSSP